jgi:hypothetical protein
MTPCARLRPELSCEEVQHVKSLAGCTQHLQLGVHRVTKVGMAHLLQLYLLQYTSLHTWEAEELGNRLEWFRGLHQHHFPPNSAQRLQASIIGQRV